VLLLYPPLLVCCWPPLQFVKEGDKLLFREGKTKGLVRRLPLLSLSSGRPGARINSPLTARPAPAFPSRVSSRASSPERLGLPIRAVLTSFGSRASLAPGSPRSPSFGVTRNGHPSHPIASFPSFPNGMSFACLLTQAGRAPLLLSQPRTPWQLTHDEHTLRVRRPPAVK
jgi:hypothetical protein